MGSMLVAVDFLGVQNSLSVQPVVAIERTVFYREKAAGMYSEFCYAFGQVAVEIPYIFVQSLVYSVIVYAMIDFEWTAGKFFWYFLVMYLALLCYTFFGMMAVGVTPNLQISAIVSLAIYLTWILFSGFFLPRTRIPVWWRWSYWADPLAWTLYGLFASQYGDKHEEIEGGQTVAGFLHEYLGMKRDFLPVVAGVMAAIVVCFALTFALSIRLLNFNKR